MIDARCHALLANHRLTSGDDAIYLLFFPVDNDAVDDVVIRFGIPLSRRDAVEGGFAGGGFNVTRRQSFAHDA